MTLYDSTRSCVVKLSALGVAERRIAELMDLRTTTVRRVLRRAQKEAAAAGGLSGTPPMAQAPSEGANHDERS